ncbi:MULTISPECIES: alpha/beta fold hydrolase [Pseudomonas]|uniref:Alpha/beta fold hydrolase n=1 Tax=Pseudomonas nitroreducens TaxID=46680 RepID=A0ABS0KF34_PSENT|nr:MULTISPECIES: alpha/beta fold hydrolase [Pseudomonas]MBG6285980.1 alpha/beta fold hydrolase [Pseudomonas nitroreducens]MCJ1883024.1 alpha/beta hydrolase [Pseudomonas nitroreducens]MCJ1894568.1 alpha/beta hydrolase [Pseudomonas nitroreducens]NMZ57747.1 alpha/beta hydrolase [Pseudomonas nitroreducens]UCL85390.1 alpha/beta hydrolase [Pseudomonas sp. HS-18]
MNSLSWVRGINATLGRVAPQWAAGRMRELFVTPNEHAPRDWELPLLASSERVTLRFGLSALRWGEGPAVLLMHGWEGRPTQFATLIENLVGAGYGVIALDGPAHGRSPGREADIVLFARALLEAAGELPPLRAVIGHSMGGASALLATQMGLRTETLVTIGAPSNVLGVLRGFSSVVGLPPVARSRFIRMIESRAGIAARQLDVARYQLDFPGLVVHAEDDRYVRVSEAVAIHEAWPQSRLLRLPAGGHHRVMADAAVIDAILELLEAVEEPLPLALVS